jgi:hypothetical protein
MTQPTSTLRLPTYPPNAAEAMNVHELDCPLIFLFAEILRRNSYGMRR